MLADSWMVCWGTWERGIGVPRHFFFSIASNSLSDSIANNFFPISITNNSFTGLLNKDPALRLGSSPLDCEAVKSHLFFESLDWAKLDRLEVAPLWCVIVLWSLGSG